MNILSLHLGHDGAITVLAGDEIIVHHQLDRFNKFKYEFIPTFELLEKVKKLNIKIDKVVTTSMGIMDFPIWFFLKKFLNITAEDIIEVNQSDHHIFHALCAKHFFQLEKDFIIFVADGDGAEHFLKHPSPFLQGLNVVENESIYDDKLESIYKKYYSPKPLNYTTDKIRIHQSIGLGKGYQKLVYELGLEEHEEGKAMALSSYGKLKEDLFKGFMFGDLWNINLLPHIQTKFDSKNSFNRFFLNPFINHLKKDSPSHDIVHTFQKAFESLYLSTLKKVDLKNKKIILTGGCAQNVLSNSNVARQLPNQILADPFNGDFGISLGAALHFTTEKVKPLKHICSGFDVDDDLIIFKDYKIKNDVSTNYVAKLLSKEPVAIFSGKSEQGQRGLGFRSLLANPFTKDTLTQINKIKKREWYRPFACTVLKEKANKYFDMGSIGESPYMMFVFKSKNVKLKNVCSPDGYSRIQTLEKSFHPKYYDLISEFEKINKHPIVLNTSLNLPGHVLCETHHDLLKIFNNTALNYCWLPDHKKLICRK